MPIYEYDCRSCGPFSESFPMSASARPAPCPRCAAQAPRVLSATAIGRTGRARKRRGAEPSLVTLPERRAPAKAAKSPTPRRPGGHGHGVARPWMLGH